MLLGKFRQHAGTQGTIGLDRPGRMLLGHDRTDGAFQLAVRPIGNPTQEANPENVLNILDRLHLVVDDLSQEGQTETEPESTRQGSHQDFQRVRPNRVFARGDVLRHEMLGLEFLRDTHIVQPGVKGIVVGRETPHFRTQARILGLTLAGGQVLGLPLILCRLDRIQLDAQGSVAIPQITHLHLGHGSQLILDTFDLVAHRLETGVIILEHLEQLSLIRFQPHQPDTQVLEALDGLIGLLRRVFLRTFRLTPGNRCLLLVAAALGGLDLARCPGQPGHVTDDGGIGSVQRRILRLEQHQFGGQLIPPFHQCAQVTAFHRAAGFHAGDIVQALVLDQVIFRRPDFLVKPGQFLLQHTAC